MSIYFDTVILVYCLVLAAIIGAVMGSFLNCAAFRISRKESFLKGRSHCPLCGHELGVPDLFPIFSWLFLRGKCRYCQGKISARYPITEAIMAVASVLVLLINNLSWLALRNWIFVCMLFLISLVDLDIYEIPNLCIIIAIVVWGGFVALMDKPLDILKDGLIAGFAFGIGMLLLALLFDKVLKKESLGGGDVKLFYVTGLYLGVLKSLFALLLSCIFGLIFAVVTKKGKDIKIPFGPSIALAAFIMLLFGGPFVHWYTSLL